MTWDELWIENERADPSEIPSEYNSLSPTGGGRVTAAYFIGVFALFYVGLKLFGSQPTLLGGFPVLMWLAVGLIILVLIGLYWFAWPSEVETTSGAGRDADTSSEEAAD